MRSDHLHRKAEKSPQLDTNGAYVKESRLSVLGEQDYRAKDFATRVVSNAFRLSVLGELYPRLSRIDAGFRRPRWASKSPPVLVRL
jgi:hypothetical protein